MQWPPTRPGEKRQEIPFRRRRFQNVGGVDTETLENRREFVDEGDVEIALGVLDHFGGLGDFDRGGAVDPRRNHRSIDRGDDIERRGVLAGNDLPDRLEPMLLVAGIDALGRIADAEIGPGFQPRGALERRRAIFLRRAGIDGRFIDDDVAFFQRAADGFGGFEQRAQIGPARLVDRRRHRDDEEIGVGEIGRIVAIAQRRLREISRLDLARAVAAGPQLFDPAPVDVEADDRGAGTRESGRDRQADIAETDDRKLAPMR